MPVETVQYKVRIPEELVERLDALAEKYGRRSGNQVAAEVLEIYTSMWEEAESARMAVIEKQKTRLTDTNRKRRV